LEVYYRPYRYEKIHEKVKRGLNETRDFAEELKMVGDKRDEFEES